MPPHPDLEMPLVAEESSSKEIFSRKMLETRVHILDFCALMVQSMALAWLLISAVILAGVVQCEHNFDPDNCALSKNTTLAYALSVGFSASIFILVCAFYISSHFPETILSYVRNEQKGDQPIQMNDHHSKIVLRQIFSRCGSSNGRAIQVKYTPSPAAPFLVFTSVDGRGKQTEQFTHVSNDVPNISIGVMEARMCVSNVRFSEIAATEVVACVQILTHGVLREFVVAPRQGWSAHRVHDELCLILL